jgi:hypothetical protein
MGLGEQLNRNSGKRASAMSVRNMMNYGTASNLGLPTRRDCGNLLRMNLVVQYRFAIEKAGRQSIVRYLGRRGLVKRSGNRGSPSQSRRSSASVGRSVAGQTAILSPVFCSIEPETPFSMTD